MAHATVRRFASGPIVDYASQVASGKRKYSRRKRFGAVAQLVAHLHGMQGVRGSSPLSSTKKPLEHRDLTVFWRFFFAEIQHGYVSCLCFEDGNAREGHRTPGEGWSVERIIMWPVPSGA